MGLLRDLQAQISFVGETAWKLGGAVLHPGRIRWGDTILIVEKAGAGAVSITALMGFLIGLILAFQSSIAMAMFGAEIYTADLVVIATFRELGPLITCFVLASRSGSAFAAELGTMKVNEEIDALRTMGIDPVRFLVLPRTIKPSRTRILQDCASRRMGCYWMSAAGSRRSIRRRSANRWRGLWPTRTGP